MTNIHTHIAPLKSLLHDRPVQPAFPLYLIRALSNYLSFEDFRVLSRVSRAFYIFIAEGFPLLLKLNAEGCFGTSNKNYVILTRLTNLESIDLSSNSIDRKDLDIVLKLTNLRRLDLSSNQTVLPLDESLQKLVKLDTLKVSDNFLRTSHFLAISMMTQLTHLTLNAKRLITPIPSCFLKTLTQLQILDISRNSAFEDRFFMALAALTSLRKLNVSRCKLTGGSHLSLAQNLESLNLSRTGLIQVGIKLDKLTKLKHLDISYNRLGDDGIKKLMIPTSLTSLNLSHTELNFSESVVPFEITTQLKTLVLYPNPLSEYALKLFDLYTRLEILTELKKTHVPNFD